jgi:hypothetical protein
MKALVKSQTFREILIFTGLMGLVLAISALVAEPTFAASLIDSSDNPDIISGATNAQGDAKELLKTMLNFFLSFLGFVATMMVIYGGVLYVTSAGNDENVGKAKKILIYAFVGIVLILLSFAIVNTILGAAVDTSTTT